MTHARKVMSELGFITDYAWLLPTYPVHVGARPGRFKRTEPHKSVIGPCAPPHLQSRAMGVMLGLEFNN